MRVGELVAAVVKGVIDGRVNARVQSLPAATLGQIEGAGQQAIVHGDERHVIVRNNRDCNVVRSENLLVQ